MPQVDVFDTEADFIEFRFSDEEVARAAEKHFPVDFVRTGTGVIEYRSNPTAVQAIRERLEAAGLAWSEAESGLTEGDMWPEWPEDEDVKDLAP